MSVSSLGSLEQGALEFGGGMCMKYMAPEETNSCWKEIWKCFPEYVQKNTSHDGCLKSQVSIASQFGKHCIFSATLKSNHDIGY